GAHEAVRAARHGDLHRRLENVVLSHLRFSLFGSRGSDPRGSYDFSTTSLNEGRCDGAPHPLRTCGRKWARTAAGGAARVASASNRTPRAIPRGAFTRRDRSDVVVHLVLDGRRVLTQAS